jgi:hypothetical protein
MIYAGQRYYPLSELRHKKSHTAAKISAPPHLRTMPRTSGRADYRLP